MNKTIIRSNKIKKELKKKELAVNDLKVYIEKSKELVNQNEELKGKANKLKEKIGKFNEKISKLANAEFNKINEDIYNEFVGADIEDDEVVLYSYDEDSAVESFRNEVKKRIEEKREQE